MKGVPGPDLFSPERVDLARYVLSREVERRAFLKKAGRWAGGLLLATYLGSLASCGKKGTSRVATGTAPARTVPAPVVADLAVAQGGSPGDLTRRALEAIGGMGRFVKQGNTVLVKPNASFLDGVDAATSTHPEIVGRVVAMCLGAGAGRVIVLDHCLRGNPDACFGANGIGDAVSTNGGEIIAYAADDKGHGVDAEIPQGRAMKVTNVYPEVLNADVFITLPKAKHHSGAGLTLGMKNLIGVTTNMSSIHNYDLHQAIADLNTLVRPDLSIIDASIILLSNGPGGPGQTLEAGTVIASPDFVAADSYACTLFGRTASDVPCIVYGSQAGLGQADFNMLKIARV